MIPEYLRELFEEGIVRLPLPRFRIIKGIPGYEDQEKVNKLSLIQKKMDRIREEFLSLLEEGKYRGCVETS